MLWWRIKMAMRVILAHWRTSMPWDRPNGCCSQCGAPLNAYMVGGYKLHDGTFSVSAKKEAA